MPKTSAVEYDRRIFTVQGWIVEGVQSALIIQQILAKEWCTSTRQAQRMLAEGRKRWIEHESEDTDEKRKLKIQELAQLARGMKDEYRGTPTGIRAQVAVQKEIIKLEGMAPAKKLAIGGDGGKPIAVDLSGLGVLELKALLEIKRKLEKKDG